MLFTVLQLMHCVSLIPSVQARDRRYVGEPSNLRHRLIAPNAGQSVYTRAFKPWRLVCYLGFASETSAKTFLKRHCIDRRPTQSNDGQDY